MVKYLILFVFLFINLVNAQQTLPYKTGFDNLTQTNGWKLFKKSAGSYAWDIVSFGSFSGGSSLSHSYPVNSGNTDNWYVSPVFEKSGVCKIDSVRFKFSGFSTPAANDTFAIYCFVGNSQDPSAAIQTYLLYDFRGTKYNTSDTWTKLTNLSIPPKTLDKWYIAFRYKNMNNSWCDVLFDNLSISGQKFSAIKQLSNKTNHLFTNPTKDIFSISGITENTSFSVFNLQGKLIYSGISEKDKFNVCAIASGNYMLQINNSINSPILFSKM